VAEFMDVEVDMDFDILVNNREADFGTLVYENFSIEWTVLSFGVADEPYEKKVMHLPEGVANLSNENANVTEYEPEEQTSASETPASSEPETYAQEGDIEAVKEAAAQLFGTKETVGPAKPEGITVHVNGEPIFLTGKKDYIFVDVFDRISFDLTSGGGRSIATLVNGKDAAFSEKLKDGDQIDLYWKEN
jgi:hypothetical protein